LVLITHGQLDRYYEPLPGGRPPPIRRSSGSGQIHRQAQRHIVSGVEYACPPWNAVPEETATSDPAGFGACRKVINLLATKMNGTVADLPYSVRKKWEKIVRAKIIYDWRGSPAAALVTCWSRSDSDVEILLKPDSSGEQ